MIDQVSTEELSELFQRCSRWLVNLRRARIERLAASVQALRIVITSSRETAEYIRQLSVNDNDTDHNTERRLSMLWTELGFRLGDLGIKNLSKRCQIEGKHWPSPVHYGKEFFQKANVSLERIEKIARELLNEAGRF